MNGKVKKGFLWGSASAAYQCEGGLKRIPKKSYYWYRDYIQKHTEII